MTTIDPNIFRAYDIRGKADAQLSEEACLQIGKGFGSVLRELYGEQPKVVAGRDARTHSPKFLAAIIQGLTSTGCQVLNIGETPSPVNYFTICNENLDAGVQITASHNPAEDNGIKLQLRKAEAYAGENLQTLRKRIEAEDFITGAGSTQKHDGSTPYIMHMVKMCEDVGLGRTIGVDCGNGVAGPIYTEVLGRVGCTMHNLYIEPDGRFPNHAADPSKIDTLTELQKLVQDHTLDAGFAYDGDGDRVGLVDEQGQVRSADEILLLLAQDHLGRNPGKPVVFTVSNSGTLQSEISAWGGKPILCKVGHSFVEHAMREHSAQLGGEQSGHFFCGENYYGFDDALMATLCLLRIVKENGMTVSELCSAFPKVYQMAEARPHCEDDAKAAVIAAITAHFQKKYPVETLDGARIDFGEDAWAGIRQSNTSPCLSICIEARSPEKLAAVQQEIFDHIQSYTEVEL